MKTKIMLLVLGFQALVAGLVAQPAATPAGAPGATNAAPVAVPPGPRPEELIESIQFDPATPVIDVLRFFAAEAGMTNVQTDVSLAPGGVVGPELSKPVGVIRFDNINARQALDRVLARHNLVISLQPDTGLPIISAKPAPVADPSAATTPATTGATTEVAATPAPNLDTNLTIEAMFPTVEELPLLVAIQALARAAQINILIDPRLKTGIMTTNGLMTPPVATNTVILSDFRGVTAEQALEAILTNYGLMRVPDPVTRFSQITFRDPRGEPLITEVVQVRYGNLTNLVDLLSLAKVDNRTTIRADARTAQLIVSATARELSGLTNLLNQLDTPTRQVLIEARFMETSQNPSTIKGIDWTETLQGQRFTFGNGVTAGQTATTIPGTPTSTTLPNGRTVTTTPGRDQRTTLSSILGAGGLSVDTSRGLFPKTAFLNAKGVDAVLSFLNTEADSKIIATPRAVTLDNQETKLEVSRGIPIFKQQQAVGAAGVAQTSSEVTYTNVGTILVVTPRVTGTNVNLKVKPEISRVEPELARKVVGGSVNEAEIFSTSKIETQVIIPSGNTLVMGGLISDSTSKSWTKVPVLGDIPVLGFAFRRESKERIKANLIIFVTPTIIDEYDFQPTYTDFLDTPMPSATSEEPSAWDRGKPLELKKNKNKKQDAVDR